MKTFEVNLGSGRPTDVMIDGRRMGVIVGMIFLFLGWLAAPLAAVTTRYVSTTGNDLWDGLSSIWNGLHGPKATIQAAVTAAEPNDTVLVAAGLYQGNGNYDINFYHKPLTLRSSIGPAGCIIDCRGLGRGFTLDLIANGNAVLDGFTIRSGWGNRGGGIYCHESAVEIRNCILTGNTANSYGGGIYCEGGDTIVYQPRIVNSVIYGNFAGGPGGGIGMYYNVQPFIANCIITGNQSNAWGGGIGLFLSGVSATITECTIAHNTAPIGGGLVLQAATDAVVMNTILWQNSASDSPQLAIQAFGDVYLSSVRAEYCNVETGVESAGLDPGCLLQSPPGNLAINPLFAAPGLWQNNQWTQGDYHLQSQAGRYDKASGQWLTDPNTSRCIAAGNPGTDPADESQVVGNDRVSIGAYAQTNQASRVPVGWSFFGDLDNNGIVNLIDFAILADTWLAAGSELPADLNLDGLIDAQDLISLVTHWLGTTTWGR